MIGSPNAKSQMQIRVWKAENDLVCLPYAPFCCHLFYRNRNGTSTGGDSSYDFVLAINSGQDVITTSRSPDQFSMPSNCNALHATSSLPAAMAILARRQAPNRSALTWSSISAPETPSRCPVPYLPHGQQTNSRLPVKVAERQQGRRPAPAWRELDSCAGKVADFFGWQQLS